MNLYLLSRVSELDITSPVVYGVCDSITACINMLQEEMDRIGENRCPYIENDAVQLNNVKNVYIETETEPFKEFKESSVDVEGLKYLLFSINNVSYNIVKAELNKNIELYI